MNNNAMNGTRKRFRRARPRGQAPSRLKVNDSRVALSMDEFTEVRVAIRPANAIIDTPMPGMNFAIASVKAVSEPASSCQGWSPMSPSW
jgi:hypothetical protein